LLIVIVAAIIYQMPIKWHKFAVAFILGDVLVILTYSLRNTVKEYAALFAFAKAPCGLP
jgi:hypothetical protein